MVAAMHIFTRGEKGVNRLYSYQNYPTRNTKIQRQNQNSLPTFGKCK